MKTTRAKRLMQGDEEQASDDAVYDAEEPSQSEGVTTVRQTKKMKEVFAAPRGVVDSKETHGQAKNASKFNRRENKLKTG